jgi:hypothetical protein
VPPVSDGIVVERRPWSELEPDFMREWGRPGGRSDPEHVEFIGPNGSGKTYFKAKLLQKRVELRHTGVVCICTKPADKTIMKLGWPIVDDWQGVRTNAQVIYWPRTKKLGRARKAYQAEKISDLLDRLWVPNSNNLIDFDEFAYVEGLSPDLRDVCEMYLREGRSQEITLMLGKQRPQGVTREMHAETMITAVFKPKDRADAERCAELLGAKRDWVPVLADLNRERYEFVIQMVRTGVSYISWVDEPLARRRATSVVRTPAERAGRRGDERSGRTA